MVTTKHNPEKDIRQLANAILRFSEMPGSGIGKWKSDLQYLAEVVAPLAQRMKNRYKIRRKPLVRVKATIMVLLLCTGIVQAQQDSTFTLKIGTVTPTQPAEKPWFDTVKVIIQVYREAGAYAIDFGDIKRKRDFVFVGMRGWQVREWKTDPWPADVVYFSGQEPKPYPHHLKLLCCDKRTEPRNVWDFKEINW